MNSIGVIFPYKRYGIWAFDDPAVGLVQEPFVAGIPAMIEILVKDIPGAEDGFALFFSATSFPQYRVELAWIGEEAGGNWYRDTSTGMEGWLCPALFQYFERAPERLFCAAAAKASAAVSERP